MKSANGDSNNVPGVLSIHSSLEAAVRSSRPLGIKIISCFLILEAMALCSVLWMGHMMPGSKRFAVDFISHLAPMPITPGLSEFDGLLVLFYALFELVMAFGFWRLYSWARLIALAEIYVYFGRGVVGLLFLWGLNHSAVSDITSSPYFITGVAERIVIWFYLVDPDTKRAFGVEDGQLS